MGDETPAARCKRTCIEMLILWAVVTIVPAILFGLVRGSWGWSDVGDWAVVTTVAAVIGTLLRLAYGWWFRKIREL